MHGRMPRRTQLPTGSTGFIGDVLPIFLCERGQPGKPLAAKGTGFLITDNVLITCWHCVSASPGETQYYAVAEWVDVGYRPVELTEVSQVPGRDIATAKVNLMPQIPLTLSSDAPMAAQRVSSFGYPLTRVELRPDGDFRFGVAGRYLEGYITRTFDHEHASYGVTPTYELDMPAPAGLSGAPLLRVGTNQVVGIVFGSNDVGTVDEFRSVDPDTGEHRPEILRMVSFGLAHHTGTLWEVAGPATAGRTLRDLLDV